MFSRVAYSEAVREYLVKDGACHPEGRPAIGVVCRDAKLDLLPLAKEGCGHSLHLALFFYRGAISQHEMVAQDSRFLWEQNLHIP